MSLERGRRVVSRAVRSGTLCLVVALGGPISVAGQEGLEAYAFLIGSWEGQLEYLDYGDDRTRIQLPTTLSCEPSANGESLDLRFAYEEPDGGLVTSIETLALADSGLYLGALWRIEEQAHRTPEGGYRFVLARQGEDNGQPASIRNTIRLSGDDLTITTSVTYAGSSESLQRHEYRLRRAG